MYTHASHTDARNTRSPPHLPLVLYYGRPLALTRSRTRVHYLDISMRRTATLDTCSKVNEYKSAHVSGVIVEEENARKRRTMLLFRASLLLPLSAPLSFTRSITLSFSRSPFLPRFSLIVPRFRRLFSVPSARQPEHGHRGDPNSFGNPVCSNFFLGSNNLALPSPRD